MGACECPVVWLCKTDKLRMNWSGKGEDHDNTNLYKKTHQPYTKDFFGLVSYTKKDMYILTRHSAHDAVLKHQQLTTSFAKTYNDL